jgi:hypothetical protein
MGSHEVEQPALDFGQDEDSHEEPSGPPKSQRSKTPDDTDEPYVDPTHGQGLPKDRSGWN